MSRKSVYQYLYMPFSFVKKVSRFLELKIILSQFKSVGEKCMLQLPVHIVGHSNIMLGDNVRIGHYSKIDTFTNRRTQVFTPELIIGDNVSMEMSCHIGCVKKVIIGDNVMLASRVYITDHNHGYENVNLPYREQDLICGETIIGDNTWIGEGAMIMPDVKVGMNCVIAAGAVVTKNIPSYSIAAGVPAKVLKQFNHDMKFWERVDNNE